MWGGMPESCSDCETCAAPTAGGAAGIPADQHLVRRGGWRHRPRMCDACGHLIRHHALAVAPPADHVAEALLPDDVLPDDSIGLGWSTPLDAKPEG